MKPKPTNTAELYLKKFKLFLLPAAFLFFGWGYWYWSLGAVDPQDQTEQVFVVPQGQTTSMIARRLKQDRLIRSVLIFRLVAEQKGLSGKLQAGEFRLNRAMTLPAIIDDLAHGSQDFWITFPEGLRVEEYAERLAEKAAIDVQAFILAAKPFEGRLFPDTYLMPSSINAEEAVKLLTETFAKKSPTTDQEMIIIASLIEREAKHEVDRPLVSSVIFNRLKIGMALQIDATVQYVLGKKDNWWPNQLTRQELQTPSPYNTYINPGLPPRPIANPGLAALRAALKPAQTDYLYYVSDPAGYNHYATTLEEHQQNIERYLPLDN